MLTPARGIPATSRPRCPSVPNGSSSRSSTRYRARRRVWSSTERVNYTSSRSKRVRPVSNWRSRGTFPDEENSYVALVGPRDYCAFLRDENGALRRYVFDGNVRDFQGDVGVNKAIADSLNDPDAPQFWWLNNGVTILASGVSTVGKRLYLDDPKSWAPGTVSRHPRDIPRWRDREEVGSSRARADYRRERCRYPRPHHSVDEQPEHESRQPPCVRRTNCSARSKCSSCTTNWFYDRRKNYWKNEDKPAERIIQIASLAQSVLGLCMRDPSSARARPSSLLKADADYDTDLQE